MIGKKFLALLLSAALLTLGASAASTDSSTAAAAADGTAYRLEAEATVTALDLTAKRPSLTVQTANGQTLQLNIGEETVVLDTQTGLAAPLSGIRKGDRIYAWYSPAMTASIPAQTACEAIVVNLDSAHAPAHLLTAESVTGDAEGNITVLTENGGLLLRIGKDAAVSPYRTKNIATIADIRMGTRFFAWYDVVATSYPGQTGTVKAVLLPQTESESLTMVLNGKTVGAAKIENGVVMVPLRKAAEALSFTVSWNTAERNVHLTNGTVQTIVTPGEDSYYMATAIPGAVGMSAPGALGAASYVVNGVTWAPAELLNLLLGGGTVTLRGSVLCL